MKVNRIKWNEKMNERCWKRLGYMSLSSENIPVDSKNVKLQTKTNRADPVDEPQMGVHAIGVGERMECELFADILNS